MRIISLRKDPWSKEIECHECGTTIEVTVKDLKVTYVLPYLASDSPRFSVTAICNRCREVMDVITQVPNQVVEPLMKKAEKNPIREDFPGHSLL